MEYSVRKYIYFLLKFRMKERAGVALPFFVLSPCVQDVAGWLYHHPSGHRNMALTCTNLKYLGCQEQQRLTCFFHINHETGIVTSAS